MSDAPNPILDCVDEILEQNTVTYVAVGKRTIPLAACSPSVTARFIRDRMNEVLAKVGSSVEETTE